MLTLSRSNSPRRRVLAVASGGGHWVQLMRLRPAFEGTDIHYATVDPSARAMVAPPLFISILMPTRTPCCGWC